MRGASGRQCFRGAGAHLFGDDAVSQDSVRGEEAGDHGGFARDAPLTVSFHESLMEVAGDDPQLRAQLKDVPSVVAKNANWRRTVGRRERALVMGQQTDQD